jgi:hypothetical protein
MLGDVVARAPEAVMLRDDVEQRTQIVVGLWQKY